MPVAMKTHHTEVVIDSQRFLVPKAKTLDLINQVKRYEIKESISPEELFSDLIEKDGKPGVLLRGLRYRENLSQSELAKKLKITQGDLSKMEHGKRTIGKDVAKRIAKIFKTDYRLFL